MFKLWMMDMCFAELPSNLNYDAPVIGLISHVDTADF